MALTAGVLATLPIVTPAQAWTDRDELPSELVYTDHPTSIAVGDDGLLYVLSRADESVTAYRAVAGEVDPTPVKSLAGDQTGMINPRGVAFDSSGRMYVVNSNTVTVYPPDWPGGNTPPLKELQGFGSGIAEPMAIAFDSADRMYVVNSFEFRGGGGSVTVHQVEWPAGIVDPIATLYGPRTGLLYPTGIAFDQYGWMYISNAESVSAYPLGWLGGDQAPIATLRGIDTKLSRPTGLGFNEAGFMFVANWGGPSTASVGIFPPDWARGNTGRPTSEDPRILTYGIPPTATISGVATLLSGPTALILDERERVLVANRFNNLLTAYSPALQTVKVDAPGSVALATPTFSFTASATSGLPVTVTSATPRVCRVRSEAPPTVEVIDIGNCILEGRQYGDEYWARAPVFKRTVTISATAQTIQFNPPSSVPLSQGILRLRATATSGLPVAWLSVTPTTCATTGKFGQRLKLLQAGTCFVQASQPGNAHWQPAPAVTGQITITP